MFPTQIDKHLSDVLTGHCQTDEVTVRAEARPSYSDPVLLEAETTRAMVEPPGTFERSTDKARRVVDQGPKL